MSRKDSLTGMQIGTVTVCGDSGRRQRGGILWDCRCGRCGESFLATRQQLSDPAYHTCGCRKTESEPKVGTTDLTGMQFGDLTVLRRVENDPYAHARWLCRCTCGEETIVLGNNLKKERIRSCGCKQYAAFRGKDLTGFRFGKLTAVRPVQSRDPTAGVRWVCRCDCGQEVEVPARQLLSGHKKSCGCLVKNMQAEVRDHLHYENDTCLERLVRAQNTTGENRAGFRGLYLTKNGSYRASITFQKTHFTLGYFGTYREAVQARLDAEERLHAGYITASEKYRARADSDPVWAANNQFFYNVVRSGGDFQISTNGV